MANECSLDSPYGLLSNLHYSQDTIDASPKKTESNSHMSFMKSCLLSCQSLRIVITGSYPFICKQSKFWITFF